MHVSVYDRETKDMSSVSPRCYTLMILVMAAFVLVLTGGVVLNMYDSGDQNEQKNWSFQWYIGVSAIVTGVLCILWAFMLGRDPERSKQLQSGQSVVAVSE
jgi:cytochrome bd-type quinol oxidase subunit 2